MTDTNDSTISFTAEGSIAGVGENVDYKSMYESQRDESERLNAVITAGRLQPIQAVPGADRKPAVTAQRLRSMLGELGFQKASRAEKLTGLGLVPSEVSDAGLAKLFGRGNDGKLAKDLIKTNPFKYKQLREAALVLNLYGA